MIEVNNLSYTYHQAETPTLKNLNFKISEGKIFGFLGPSGAGKSTTQKILYKTLQNYSGSISIDGTPLKKLSKEYYNKIGVGFELPNHYLKLTGKENLELFASFYSGKYTARIEELFNTVGLEDSINKPVESYSKGMKMRLNFIRAILHNPDIIFFDEPTAGLDPVNAHKIKELILELKEKGKTIFITTHNMTTADELCDRVAFIVDGEINVIDTPKNLKKQYGKETVAVTLHNGASAEFSLNKLGENKDFINFINQDEVKNINTLDATLEEVFIKVTGKTLKV